MDNFPHQGIRQVDIDAYNKQSKLEFEQIRDFIIPPLQKSATD